MSSFQSQLISQFRTGLDTDQEPWVAPIDSFSLLDNVHVHHGYLEKRSGFRVFGQLIPPAATIVINDVTQADPGVVTTAAAHGYSTDDKVVILAVGGMTEINNKSFTIIVLGATTFSIGVDTTDFTAYTVGGTVQLTAILTDRVMGLWRYIDDTNTKDLLGFDTLSAQLFNSATQVFTILDPADIMSGSETDYIVATNWQGSNLTNRLYFTNGKAYDGAALDGIRYYDGNGAPTVNFNTNSLGGTRTLYGGKLLFVIKQRLIVLHTFENTGGGASFSTFPQRARWCQAQGPSNWNDLIPGGGGFVDAPTGEQIISAQALQDIIIVFFTNSVWTLRPVPDPALPFRWDKINDFRACDGKMATVGYDRDVRALGVRGITSTDGVETRRIDERIEDFTINEINFEEFEKVFCLRSFSKRRWWTLFPRATIDDLDGDENSAALIWDDESSAYSTYTIAMNCLGYGNFGQDYSLDDFTAANDLDLALNDFAEETLQSYFWQEDQEALLGGDINGTVFVMETGADDNSLPISTDIFSAAWNPFKDQGIECQMSYIDFFVDTDLITLATIEFYKNNDQSPYLSQDIDFLPDLGFISTIGATFNTNPVEINSAGHGLATGDVIYIYLVQGMVEVNSGPYAITVTGENDFTLDGIDGTLFGIYTTGGQVVTRPFCQTKTWKRAYAGAYAYQHRIKITSSGNDAPMRIHAFKPAFRPRGKRTID